MILFYCKHSERWNMNWYFICPVCFIIHSVSWENRYKAHFCIRLNKIYHPPQPIDEPEAFVDTPEWPPEMEEAVISAKGIYCSVPGCSRHYHTLEHRIPWSKGGTTSFNNLFPVCNEHKKGRAGQDNNPSVQRKPHEKKPVLK
jgi:hypothetical protein